jgi:ABC-2 type transport system permease protein
VLPLKQTLAIALFEVKKIFKNRKSWIPMFVMPIVFALVFGGLQGYGADKTKLAIVDQDQTSTSHKIIEQLQHDKMMDISLGQTDQAKTQLKDQKIAGIITIPKGLEDSLQKGEEAELSFQHGPNLSAAAAIDQTLQNILSRSAVQMQAAHAWSEANRLADATNYYQGLLKSDAANTILVHSSVVSKNRATKQLNGMGGASIGFGIMFMMSTLVSVTGVMLEARKSGIWYRMMATPVRRIHILSGYLLSFVLTGWIQFGILMAISSIIFGVHWGNWLGVIVLVTAMVFAIVGLGLCMAGFVKTSEQQNALGTLVVVATCMLGGVFWPLDIVPDLMRKIAEAMPQFWAMQGFTELIARGGTLTDILQPVAVLFGFAVLFLGIGIARVRFE